MPSSNSESLPSLQPRPLASPSSARWDHDGSQKLETGQQRYQPGAPLSAPFAGHSQLASYNPQLYGSIRGGPNSPLGPPRAPNGNPGTHPDTSKWGIKFNHGYSRSQDQRPKPSLPVSRVAILLLLRMPGVLFGTLIYREYLAKTQERRTRYLRAWSLSV